ncbi:hypothetical protein KY385_01295 [Candidatus Parcubacteria bacterium]|nr:hypothetical protein [Candidatus Parcubacteria bacterium]
MAKEQVNKKQFEKLTAQEEKILRLLREERNLLQKKFPLPYALFAFFGFVATWAGLFRLIQETPLLNNNPIFLIVLGLSILIITGAAYRKLG